MDSINKQEETDYAEGLELWSDGVERGTLMAEFVNTEVIDLSNTNVLDLGCGMGGISIAFSERSKTVVSVDLDFNRLLKVRNRIHSGKVHNINILNIKGMNLPFKTNTFDLVIVNGVLEYMGLNADGQNPRKLQIEALKEIRRVLKNNGIAYIGIENRYYPPYLFGDVHCGLPLVAMLPRALADLVSYILSNRPFQHYIYSYWELKNILKEAAFSRVDMYVPIFNYQYPILIRPLSNRRAIYQALEQACHANITDKYKKMSFGKTPRIKTFIFQAVNKLCLMKLLSPCFVAVAKKCQVPK